MILSNVNKIHMERQIQSSSENLDDSRLIAQNPYVRCGACEKFVCAWENIGKKKIKKIDECVKFPNIARRTF